MDTTRILLDSDFCNMITEINSDHIDSRAILDKLFSAIGKKPCLHEYLAKEELFDNEIIQEFITAGKISLIKYNEIAPNDENLKLYSYTFKAYYYTANAEEFNGNCFLDRLSGKNMGEIHSIIAARFLGIPLFYTNDNGARSLAKKYNTQDSTIKLVSGLDVMIEYSDRDIFNRNARRLILKKYEKSLWREKYESAISKIIKN